MTLYIGNKKVCPVKISYDVNNQDKTILQNGTFTADAGYSGLGTVTVNVSSGLAPTIVECIIPVASGSPTITDGIASGFATDKGLQLPIPFSAARTGDYGSGTIQIETNICFQTPTSWADRQGLILSTSRGSEGKFTIHCSTSGVLTYYTGSSETASAITLNTNTEYFLKIKQESASSRALNCYIIEKGIYTIETLPDISQWTFAFQIAGGTNLTNAANVYLGCFESWSFWNGTIDMNNTNTLINGVEAYRGRKTVYLPAGDNE